LPEWRSGKEFKESYSASASRGGGVHLDLIHELDYTTWIFGFPCDTKSVFKSISSLNIESFDYANYILEYKTFTANIILNYYRRKPKREIEIVLEKETWLVDLIKNEVKNDKNELLFQDLNFNIKQTYANQLQYFINCLINKHSPMNSLEESIEVLKICLKND
jgi:predicted dehydrogenase